MEAGGGNFCGQCGAKLGENSKFCGSCGAETAAAGAPSPKAGDSPATETRSEATQATPEASGGKPAAYATSAGAGQNEAIAASLEKARALPLGTMICGIAGVILLLSFLMKYVGPSGLASYAPDDVLGSKSLFSSSPVVGLFAVVSMGAAIATPIVYSRGEDNVPNRFWAFPLIASVATVFGLVIVALRPPGGGLESYVTGPKGGLYIGLLSAFGICVGALMLPGAPFGPAAKDSDSAVSFADSLRHVRSNGDNLALVTFVLSCAGPLTIILAALTGSVALVWIGLLVTIAGVITAGIAKSGARKAGDEVTEAFARKAQWLGGSTLIALALLLIALIVVLAQAADDLGINDSENPFLE